MVLAGRAHGAGLAFQRLAKQRLQPILAEHAAPQQARAVARQQADDARLQAHLAGAAVENPQVAVGELLRHVLGAGRADRHVAVGRGRHQATSEGRQQRLRARVRRHAQGHAVLAGGDAARDLVTRRQHQGQRPRPAGVHQPSRGWWNLGGPLANLLGAGQVHDQWIAAWPPLEREDLLHRRRLAGIGGQAVDGFGGHGDQVAGAQAGGALLDIGGNQGHGGVCGTSVAESGHSLA